MKKIYFEYHLNTVILDTLCPYVSNGTPSIYSGVCIGCKYYHGKFKKENAIQCSGDEHLNLNNNKSVFRFGINNKKNMIKDKKLIMIDRFLLTEKKMQKDIVYYRGYL
jgi:hypothetical protein